MAGMEAGSGAKSIAVERMASVCAGVGVVAAVLVLHSPAASAPSRRRAAREGILPSCLALLQSIHRAAWLAPERSSDPPMRVVVSAARSTAVQL